MKLSLLEVLRTERVLAHSRPTPKTKWEHILVPVDFTVSSREALKLAVSLAADPEDRITLLHVVAPEHWLHRGNAVAMILNRSDEELTSDAERRLQLWARQEAGPDIEVETIVRKGRASEEIIRLAKANACDLIVSGSEPENWLERLFGGGLGWKLQRKAPCAVVSIRSSNPVSIPVRFEPEQAWRQTNRARPRGAKAGSFRPG